MDPTSRPEPAPAPSGRGDALAARLLGRPLALLLGGLCLVQLASWAPSYLLWPWWADHDVFATAALSWEAGIRPYRDFACNNFPGTIYVFWALGKLFGWGRTAPFWAFDLALVAALGITLWAWSRRCFGRAAPGLLAYALFLSSYLDLNYALAAQRESHAGVLVVLSLLALQAWPGPASAVAAGLGMAAALAFRPQVVLFLPAIVVAVAGTARTAAPDRWRGRAARDLSLGALAFAAGVALVAWPLVRHGIADDFLRALDRVRPGSSYNQTTLPALAGRLLRHVNEGAVWVVPLAALVLLPGATRPDRRRAAAWLVALAGALVYPAISPYPHSYLVQPLVLTGAVLAGVVADLILREGRLTPSLRLLALLVVVPGLVLKPAYCAPNRAVKALAGREAADLAPTGYTTTPAVESAGRYAWGDYRAALDYLRDEVPPGRRVANALYYCPAVTGPTARLSAFPTESLAWVRLVEPAAAERFATELAGADVPVLWCPAEEARLRDPGNCGPIVDAIRAHFQPARRFGVIELWTRITPVAAAGRSTD